MECFAGQAKLCHPAKNLKHLLIVAYNEQVSSESRKLILNLKIVKCRNSSFKKA